MILIQSNNEYFELLDNLFDFSNLTAQLLYFLCELLFSVFIGVNIELGFFKN
jgi:hypothetical protein